MTFHLLGVGVSRWRSEEDDERINLHHSFENTSFTTGENNHNNHNHNNVLSNNHNNHNVNIDLGYDEGEDDDKVTLSSFTGQQQQQQQQHHVLIPTDKND